MFNAIFGANVYNVMLHVKAATFIVVGHRLEIIIDHRLESVAAVDAIF